MKNYRGRVHDGGVDVINGISGMEHLSNSLVRKPLQNFNAATFQPQPKAGSMDYGFKNNNEAVRRSVNTHSRENSRGSGANNRTVDPEVAYDPFYSNQQRYLAAQKAAVNKQN